MVKWFYVYKLTCKITQKSYIGVTTTSVEGRIARHACAAKRGRRQLICKAIRKYGIKSFKVRILRRTKSTKKLLKLETKLIRKYKTLAPNGYNIAEIGGLTLGVKFSKKSRDKISKSRIRGLRNETIIPWNKGKTFTDSEKKKYYTEEWKKKQSKSHKGERAWNRGIPFSEKTKRKLRKAKASLKVRKEISKRSKNLWKDPNFRKNQIKKMSTKAYRSKISKAIKERWENPTSRKKLISSIKRGFRLKSFRRK